MPTPLDAWQQRLQAHFGGLAASRSASGFPIFALEHGLDHAELEEIGKLLRSELAAGARLYRHWLLWVVYATEQGYAYDGTEYWVSFEENTPHWGGYCSAKTLRRYFIRFQESYNGVIPSGAWADWFCNIARPITPAILPRYLQFQIANAPYE